MRADRRSQLAEEQKQKRQLLVQELRRLEVETEEIKDDLMITVESCETWTQLPRNVDLYAVWSPLGYSEQSLLIVRNHIVSMKPFVFSCTWLPATLSVFDVVYDKEKQNILIRDCLVWAKQPLYDCDSMMRFWWLQSKWQELNGERILMDQSTKKSWTLNCAPRAICNAELLQQLVASANTLNGVWWYDAQLEYVLGSCIAFTPATQLPYLTL